VCVCVCEQKCGSVDDVRGGQQQLQLQWVRHVGRFVHSLSWFQGNLTSKAHGNYMYRALERLKKLRYVADKVFATSDYFPIQQ
jgi:hypothetical protein